MNHVNVLRDTRNIANPQLWMVVLLLLASLLVGCAAGEDADRRESLAIEAVIIYEREGGFAGISQEWVIHLDGSIDGPGEQQLTVPPEEVEDLVETTLDAEIESLASEMATPDACCDQFTYTLTFIAGNEEWTLVMTDTSEPPDEVSELFTLTEELIADAQPVP